MDQVFQNDAALIVGGTAGIGFASARKMLNQGLPALTIVGRNPDRGQAALEKLTSEFPGANIHYLACDCTDARATEAMAQKAAQLMDGLSILISSGGGDPIPELLHKMPIEDMMPIITMIAGGTLHPAKAVLPIMTERGGGSIICFASDAGKLATPGETVIGAAMAAIAMFCRGMAIEAKRHQIRVNCITPSIVSGTDLYGKLMDNEFAGKIFAKAKNMASLGLVNAEDLAETVAFLASPAASKMTGQTISVTGGISAI